MQGVTSGLPPLGLGACRRIAAPLSVAADQGVVWVCELSRKGQKSNIGAGGVDGEGKGRFSGPQLKVAREDGFEAFRVRAGFRCGGGGGGRQVSL